ncbi:cof family hydrolase [Planococcus antarcticus DSM 14505]|uniref:Cof family hydrolase n=1 Tax=Planococcus antarcticus DSM 14505 TaxID=1185653 RepID=A0AA87LTL8_9BACL|nr:Cof-type HAD-IIB family hydrolase [Planococcus antarcticus]EIM05505.1 cof family hydrolase [Planococcus antarcticus DSM 14505]
MYKMIAIDLDGTLLTDELTISPETVATIQKAMKTGTIVTIATGRMFSSAKLIAQQLGINAPLITYQGAMIKAADGDDVLYERSVSPDISQKLLNIAREKNIHLQVYQDDILYGAVETDKLVAYAEAVQVPYAIEPDLIKLAQKGFTKLLFIDEPDVLALLQKELQAIFGDSAYIEKSKKNYLEVTHPEANKGNALLFLANKLGIDRSEIIGIGDNHNDFELLKSAGFGIAMGNAVQEVKDIADYITFTNNDEGVIHAIDKFILEPENAVATKKGREENAQPRRKKF